MSDPVTDARAQCRVQNLLSWRWGEVKGKKDPTRSRVYIFWSRVADMILQIIKLSYRDSDDLCHTCHHPSDNPVHKLWHLTLFLLFQCTVVRSYSSQYTNSLLLFTVFLVFCWSVRHVSRRGRDKLSPPMEHHGTTFISMRRRALIHTAVCLSLMPTSPAAMVTAPHTDTGARSQVQKPFLGIIAMVITKQLRCWHLAIISTPGHQVTDSTSPWRGNSCSSICYSSVTKLTFSCYISLDSNNRRCRTNN